MSYYRSYQTSQFSRSNFERERWRNVYEDIDKYPDKHRDNAHGFVVGQLKAFIIEGLKRDKCDDSQVARIFTDLDVNKESFITCDVFVQEMSKKERKSAFEDEFFRRDRNSDGTLDINEVRDAYLSLGVKEEMIDAFMKRADINHDNRMSKDEYMKAVHAC